MVDGEGGGVLEIGLDHSEAHRLSWATVPMLCYKLISLIKQPMESSIRLKHNEKHKVRRY